jgi:hypothetical protein
MHITTKTLIELQLSLFYIIYAKKYYKVVNTPL